MAHLVVDADIDVSQLAQNYAFSIQYFDIPTNAQPHNQLQSEVTDTNYNNPHISLPHILIQHLHSYYLVILHYLLAIFGLATRA